MAVLGNVATIVFSYFIASDLVFLAIRRFLKDHHTFSDKRLFWLSRGTGPIVISLLLYVLFLFFPHRQPIFYILPVIVLFLLMFFLSRSAVANLRGVYGDFLRDLGEIALPGASVILLAIVALVSLAVLILGIAYPIVEHDCLTTAMEARIMFREMSMENFLAIDMPDPQTGYSVPNFRPPFVQLFYVWFSLIRGPESMDLLARTASPIYALHCFVLLGYVVFRRWSSRHALWSVFLLAATPLFFYVSYNNNAVDPARMYFAFLALVWFAEWSDHQKSEQNHRLTVVVGIFSGFALYSHLLGAPAVLAGALTYLAMKGQRLREKVVAVFLLAMVAAIAGAQYHYLLNSVIREQLLRSIGLQFVQQPKKPEKQVRVSEPQPTSPAREDATPPANERRARVSKPQSKPPVPSRSRPTTSAESRSSTENLPSRAVVPVARGQGSTPLSQLTFGRLQIFTGIEYFGFLFYLFWIAVILWLRKSSRTTLEKLLVVATVIYCVAVLSGLRSLSWSSPRYIGSLIMIGAYFGGPLLVSLEDRLALRVPRSRRPFFGALVFCLAFPLILVTTIRGAKVEITNPGNFYSDFRSLRWLELAWRDPWDAGQRFWENYTGIRRTITYSWADDATKLRHAHDYFAAIQYINENTPPEARVMVFRDARFFYYGERYGIVWYRPEIRGFRRAKSAEQVFQVLRSSEVTHVLIDSYSETLHGYRGSRMGDMLADRNLVELVYEYGAARVYRLREAATDE